MNHLRPRAHRGVVRFALATTLALAACGDDTTEGSLDVTAPTDTAPDATAPADADAQVATDVGPDVDPGPPTLSVADTDADEGDAGSADLTFTVTLSRAPGAAPVTVDYATRVVPGGAVEDRDFIAASGTLTFSGDTTALTVVVSMIGDTTLELDEPLALDLTAPTGASIDDGEALGTITNDDDAPSISIDDVSVVEGGAGATTAATFTLTLAEASGIDAVVAFETQSGTAVATGDAATGGADFLAKSGTVTFPAGETQQTLTIEVVGDDVHELDEVFFLRLSTGTGVTVPPDAHGQATVENDEPVPQLQIDDETQVESSADLAFTVTLSGASSQAINLAYASADDTATAASDYTAVSGTLAFPAGTTGPQPIVVALLDDDDSEPSETFTLALSDATPSGLVLLPERAAVGTIADDADSLNVSIGNVVVDEGDAATTAAHFELTLSRAAPAGGLTVKASTADGTATGGAGAAFDYVPRSDVTVTFAEGATSASFDVQVRGEKKHENNERFFVNLASPSSGALADAQGRCIITDDDPAPTVSVADLDITEGTANDYGDVVFTVTLSAESGLPAHFTFAADIDDRPNAPSPADASGAFADFKPTRYDDVVIAAGDLTTTLTVPVRRDSFDDANNETFLVRLSNLVDLTQAGSDLVAVGTIADDDPLPKVSVRVLSVQTSTVTEGPPGSGFATSVALELNHASSRAVTATIALSGTATLDGDYTLKSGTSYTFNPGLTYLGVQFLTIGDATDEPNETIITTVATVSATATINAAMKSATTTIIDDD